MPTQNQSDAAQPLKEKKEKKKPGNRGDFHGMREDFLNARLDAYMAASKLGKTRDFWPELFKDYWEKFHWRLAITEDPALDATPVVDGTLSPEDTKAKEAVLKLVKAVSIRERRATAVS